MGGLPATTAHMDPAQLGYERAVVYMVRSSNWSPQGIVCVPSEIGAQSSKLPTPWVRVRVRVISPTR